MNPQLTQDSTGVLTKGTILEVNVSELGMVTTGGKVVWSSACFSLLRGFHSLTLSYRVCSDHK